MEATIYNDIWIRWIPFRWSKDDYWRTDIRQNVLNDASLNTALFVLEDLTCVFIQMSEIRKAIVGVHIRDNGSIPFNIDPHSKVIGNVKIKMEVHKPRNKNRVERLFDKV
jgi:hypothetical protein